MRRPLVLLTLTACVAFAREAAGTPSFPDVVASHLALAATPDCALCHTKSPARGNVTTPFGASMRARGMSAYDEGSVSTALDALDAERKDSDGDGAPDVDELRAGADPNAGDGETIVPEYGCAAGPRRGTGEARALWGLAVAAVVARRRARPRGSNRSSGSVGSASEADNHAK